MYKTKNDLPEASRAKIIELLNARLADCIDLSTQTKQAHWNVKGSHFYSLHLLFDEVFEHATENVDLIAERIVQLGGVALGTARSVAKKSTLEEYSLTISQGDDHVEALSSAMAATGKSIRAAIDLASEMKDAGTADLFTEVSRSIDKDLWFVESHLTR